METLPLYLPYLVVLAVAVGRYLEVRRRTHARAFAIKQAAAEAGATEPVSLHPLIDPTRCMGCGTCIKACPEGDILGLIDGKADLIEPSHCIGHGACRTACPTNAISLVFGTAERGVDLPVVGPDFQSSVAGIYIAGELGGMGLIRNAITQGQQAVAAIASCLRPTRPNMNQIDLVIVGAGPAGIAAALAAKQHGLSYLVLEQDDLGGTVFKYPRGKVVVTAPVVLPLIGTVAFREVSKEALLAFWRDVETREGLAIRYRQRVERIEAQVDGFSVHTKANTINARTVLLAIGRRGTPRQLGVPGEALPKTVYQLVDPAQYRGRQVLVVGGGDTALEAAASLAEQPGTTVTLSYRGAKFGRARANNRARVTDYAARGRLALHLQSRVLRIDRDSVLLQLPDNTLTVPNDAVIICAGGVLPSDFLAACGIAMETKYGTA